MRSEEHLFKLDRLEELLEEWKSILHLEQWDISLRIRRQKDFLEGDNQGEITFNRVECQAIIHILDPIDWVDILFNQDMEKTLVHELLHIIYADFEPEDSDSLQYTLWHRSIDSMARVLVSLKRKGEAVK
jgi:hypothetical protein